MAKIVSLEDWKAGVVVAPAFGGNIDEGEVAFVIPARLESTRFPEKMLVNIDGVPLIKHVYNQVIRQVGPDHVFIATNSKKIASLFPADRVVMTTDGCKNGTERVAEASMALRGYYYFVNVQGDLVKVPNILQELADTFVDKNEFDGTEVMTVIKDMVYEDRKDPNTVKCINNGDMAHWFCRAPLEYGDWHIGIYAYTAPALFDYSTWSPRLEEEKESLEQLRWIQNDVELSIMYTEDSAFEINSREDLDQWQDLSTLLN